MSLKKIYTIATMSMETYGQGDYGEELKIEQEGCYHKRGHFGPVFVNRSDAEEYLKNLEWKHGKEVVALDVI